MLRSILARGSMIFVPAALAADFEIHADTQHIKTVGTTGVRFLGLDHIADLYIHGSTPPFLC